jgi:hypothetical protein
MVGCKGIEQGLKGDRLRMECVMRKRCPGQRDYAQFKNTWG